MHAHDIIAKESSDGHPCSYEKCIAINLIVYLLNLLDSRG